jgi:hypothetical protein
VRVPGVLLVSLGEAGVPPASCNSSQSMSGRSSEARLAVGWKYRVCVAAEMGEARSNRVGVPHAALGAYRGDLVRGRSRYTPIVPVPCAARIWSWRWLTSYDGALACSATAVVGARYSLRRVVDLEVSKDGELYYLSYLSRGSQGSVGKISYGGG